MLNDDDWELFVPVVGEEYPDNYQAKLYDDSEWQDGGSPGCTVRTPTCFAYRKPKQKETKMTARTPQQAMQDAIDSGAVAAWINGEEVEFHRGDGDWFKDNASDPNFSGVDCYFRPKPQEPTKIDWRPVVTGKEPKGVVLCAKPTQRGFGVHALKFEEVWYDENGDAYSTPTHWAPMCNLPEGDK